MKKTLFIDRDGTILKEPADEQIDNFEKFSFVPGVITALAKIALEMDYDLVMVTNQDGAGTPLFPEDDFWPFQNKMTEILEGEGIKFSNIFIDTTLPSDNAPTRKPGTAMLVNYLAQGIDLKKSYVIGDRQSDIDLAKNLSCNAIFLGKDKPAGAVFATTSWDEIYLFLKAIPRTATVSRKTKETDIYIYLNIDGTGKADISTGLGFFDHMLEQIPRHGNFDLTIKAKGDLHVDAHHLIEDTGICLGEAFLQAAGSKKGIERYSFTLPMDESLSQVTIDLGGRPWLIWDTNIGEKTIGGIPGEMFYHFFKSFSDNAKCNLNISAKGENGHHIIESIFKAFAKTMKNALQQTGNFRLPTTKGTL